MATRVAIFVDGANMFYAQRDNRWNIDYKKVYEYFTTNKDPVMAFYFTAKPTPSTERPDRLDRYKRFRQALIHIGYSVIDKEVRVLKDDETGQIKLKGNLDIDMAFQMLAGRDKYDEAVILGGDSDFAPIFEYLRNIGKDVVSVGRRGSTALDLINVSSRFVDLESIRSRIAK